MTSTDGLSRSSGPLSDADTAPAEQVDAPRDRVLREVGGSGSGGRVRSLAARMLSSPASAAVTVWLVGVPLAVLTVHVLDMNPLTSRGALLPMAVGLLLVVVLALAALRVRAPVLAGTAAGAAAVWVELCLTSAYHGTPFGDSGLRGDAARFTAMVTRFTVTLRPVDAFVPSVPTEYPPLFPWLIARVANLTHKPGWALVGDAQALLMSLTVLVGFLLWQRLVPAWPALMVALAAPLAFSQPRKVYEIFTMAIVVPCALAALSRFRRPGGLHWLPAGLALGVILQVYQGYLLFTAAGLAALAVLGWRDANRRGAGRAYLLHLAGIVVTALVVAAWYLVPFVHALLTIGGPRVNDLYVAGEITSDPFAVDRLIDGPLAPLMIAGLIGLIALRRRRWWATPLLLLLGGAYLYRMVYLLVFVMTGHTGYLDYTGRIISMILIVGGVLTLWTVAPIIADRLPRRPPAGIGAASAAVFSVTAMFTVWQVWTPSPIGASDQAAHPTPGGPNLATYAHAEPLPNGKLPRFHPTNATVPWFPTTSIQAAVERRLGTGAQPLTVSSNEKLFAFLPWPAYVAVERQASNTFTHWDDRVAELRALSRLSDPVAFAGASRATRFGAIDVFVLTAHPSYWGWGPLKFTPRLFDPAYWWVEQLPNNTVVAIRR
ncbi:MAG TPA: arabinofuranosyltransferase [Kineosporiaceae bacterium]|nr:arabinofuranosyltransferase [Kineosporiaceae bacterium]